MLQSDTGMIELKVVGILPITIIDRIKGFITRNRISHFFKYYVILHILNNTEKQIEIKISEDEIEPIALGLIKTPLASPTIHDVFKTTTDEFGLMLKYAFINEITPKKNLKSILKYSKGEKIVEINARPADSISMALMHNCPIFIDKNTYDKYLDIKKN